MSATPAGSERKAGETSRNLDDLEVGEDDENDRRARRRSFRCAFHVVSCRLRELFGIARASRRRSASGQGPAPPLARTYLIVQKIRLLSAFHHDLRRSAGLSKKRQRIDTKRHDLEYWDRGRRRTDAAHRRHGRGLRDPAGARANGHVACRALAGVETPKNDFHQVHCSRSNRAHCAVEQRLLSPAQAATYLGLGSRFAVYRLIATGELAALHLANKLRLDVDDLDAMIERAKVERPRQGRPRTNRAPLREVPKQLAPPTRRRRPVTARVIAPLPS